MVVLCMTNDYVDENEKAINTGGSKFLYYLLPQASYEHNALPDSYNSDSLLPCGTNSLVVIQAI